MAHARCGLDIPPAALTTHQRGSRTGVPDKQTLCVGFCFQNTIADRNFWSQASTTRYDWTTLDAIGFPINSEIEALGLQK